MDPDRGSNAFVGDLVETTHQKLRDEGSVRFSQPQKKIILYDRDSVMEYLDKHAKDIF